MASTKDTFEAATFLANSFAMGAFRGTGVSNPPPTISGLEYTAQPNRLHYTMTANLLHFTMPDNRLHFTFPEDD